MWGQHGGYYDGRYNNDNNGHHLPPPITNGHNSNNNNNNSGNGNGSTKGKNKKKNNNYLASIASWFARPSKTTSPPHFPPPARHSSMAHNGRDKHGKKSEEAIPLTSDQDVPTSVTFNLGSPTPSFNNLQQQQQTSASSSPPCPTSSPPPPPSSSSALSDKSAHHHHHHHHPQHPHHPHHRHHRGGLPPPPLPSSSSPSSSPSSSSSRPAAVEEAPPSHMVMWGSGHDVEPVLSRDTSTDLQDNVTRLSFLHDEVDKLFEHDWRINTSTNLPCADPNLSTLEREPSKVALTELYHVDEAEYSRHRRVSYPHIHQPLRSLSSKSLLAAKAKAKKKSKKKKKRKEKKIRSFPSRVAIKSPPIPEEEEEHHQFIDDDDDEDTSSSSQSDDYDDMDDVDRADGHPDHHHQHLHPSDPLSVLASSKSAPDVTTPTSPSSTPTLPTLQLSSKDFDGSGHSGPQPPVVATGRPGSLNTDGVGFYIGNDIPSPTDGAERLVKERGSPVLQEEKQPLIGTGRGQDEEEEIKYVPRIEVAGSVFPPPDSELSPLIEQDKPPQGQVKHPSPILALKEPVRKLSTISTGGKVTFVVGDDSTYTNLQSLHDSNDPSLMEEGAGGVGGGEGEALLEADKENDRRHKRRRGSHGGKDSGIEEGEGIPEGRSGSHRLSRTSSVEGSQSNRSSGKRRHHPHHQHFKQEDLILRRQKGSEVRLDESMHRSPTETEEAATLYRADLDEMASHRFEDQRGIRRHKIARSKGALQSIVHIGKVHHERKPRVTKKFDHSPHEVFVELDELHFGGDDMLEWREKARWIKFEEDVEEGAERWGKPHVASLSFHSLLELRRGLEKGSMLLDLEATDLTSIIHNVVENLIIRDLVPEEVKGKLLKTLLLKHKHVSRGSDFLRRISSYSNLLSLDSSKRHQSEKGLLGSLSHSSIGSSLGLHKSPSQTSQAVPGSPSPGGDTPGIASGSGSSKERRRSKDHGKQAAKLEMFKVDVDNNMTDKLTDGIHIGVTPIEEEKEKKHIQDIMKRIPKGSEASTVLVGQVDFLKEPAMAFVRLSEGRMLENLTEVPLPVRFVFILLGPEKGGMDYHEVGRSLSTLMSNQHFHNVAYRAESREDLLRAINGFLDDSIVLPPGDWDHRTLLPITHMARRRAHMKQQKKQQLEKEALIAKGVKMEPPRDPLQRTGCLFGGLVNDIKQRYPFYLSDIKDAANGQCIATLFFIFFTCLSPCIAFGGLLSEKTDRLMGVSETMLATSLFGMLFSLFSGQPLLIIGATGPVLVFEESLYKFCNSNGLEFLPVRFWIGMWVCVITMAAVALEGSFLLRYISRFTEEIFATLISLIFIYEVIKKLMEIFVHHPLMADYCGLDNQTLIGNGSSSNHSAATAFIHLHNNASDLLDHLKGSNGGGGGVVMGGNNDTSAGGHQGLTAFGSHVMDSDDKIRNQPNTALLSLILTLGTFLIAYFMRVFRNSKFLGRSVRRALGDFGVLIALVCMVFVSFLMKETYVQKLDITDPLTPTSPGRGWFINPMGVHTSTPVWIIFASILPAFLIFILLFMETQITEMILDKKERKLKKGSGFHLDQALLGVLTMLGGLFGLPWMCAATVRTVAHVSALSIYSRTHAPGEKPQLLGVKEQRVTNFAVHFLIGLSTAMGPVLREIPVSALFGIFLYLGVSAMSGVQMYERVKLLLMPVKYHPSVGYVRKVPMFQMHKFTLIQLVCLIVLLVIKSTAAALAFPFMLVLLIPLRIKFVSRFFLPSELSELDKEEEDLGYEDEDDPDFYQQAHMPI